MKTALVRSAAALVLTCGAAVAGASAASAQDVPYPPVQAGPGVGSTVEVKGVVVTRSTSGIAVGSVVGDPAAASGLASTGVDVLPWAAGGGALLVVGAGLVLGARRRHA